MTILLNILYAILAVAATVVIFHILSAITQDRRMEYREISYASPKITPELDGCTIAFITDTHFIPERKLRSLAHKISRRDVDLLLLGGDYLGGKPLDRALAIIKDITTKNGIFGVDGNHDNYQELYYLMRKYGLVPLDNEGVRLYPHLYLAGVQDLWMRDPDIKKAVRNAEDDDFVLLLAHNPYLSMIQNTAKVDLMLCGHTHGGHISFFGLWSPALTNIKSIVKSGQKFVAGWVKAPYDTDVFISRGTGSPRFMPRIYAAPQVIYLTLRHCAAGEQGPDQACDTSQSFRLS